MSPDQQRIKIAEACGWTRHGAGGIYGCWDDPDGHTRSGCPDYLNDLNAMHEAMRNITATQYEEWLDWLDVAAGGELQMSDMLHGGELIFNLVNTTAAQRAEALLRTLGLWKEAQSE